jgi:hypothetical protein
MKTFQQFQEDAGILSRIGSGIANSAPAKAITSGLSALNKKATTLKHAAGIHKSTTPYMQRGELTRQARMKVKGINPKNPSNMPVDDSQYDGRIMVGSGKNSKMPISRGPVKPKTFMGKPTKYSQLDV